MKSRYAKSFLFLGFGVLALAIPLASYVIWDQQTEHSAVADQLRKLSIHHEHNHPELFKTEHRRHYEAFDFDAPFLALKPKVQAMFTGNGWKGKDEADFIEYENVGEGRVNFIRFAKNQAVGMFGEPGNSPTGDNGLRPWAVVMYKGSWYDEMVFEHPSDLQFPIFSPYFWGYSGFLFVLFMIPLKRRNAAN